MFVLICGAGRVGSSLARTMLNDGHQVSCLDEDPESHARLEIELEKPWEDMGGQFTVGTALEIEALQAAGIERGKRFTGIHHIGFEVEDMATIAEKLAAAGSTRRDDVNQALGVGDGHRKHNVEVKYGGPDGIMIDVSETGWVGTS